MVTTKGGIHVDKAGIHETKGRKREQEMMGKIKKVNVSLSHVIK